MKETKTFTSLKNKTSYCVVGGLAVNAYVEPVVSLDLDVIIDISDPVPFPVKAIRKAIASK